MTVMYDVVVQRRVRDQVTTKNQRVTAYDLGNVLLVETVTGDGDLVAIGCKRVGDDANKQTA